MRSRPPSPLSITSLAPPLREGYVYTNGGFVKEKEYHEKAKRAVEKQFLVEIGAVPHEADMYEPGDKEWKSEWDSLVDPEDYPMYFAKKRRNRK